MTGQGGYDDGYDLCPCFWGSEPSSLVKQLVASVESVAGWRVLDAGCGEGKNAIYLSRRGAVVRAVDVSQSAIRNAKQAWPDFNSVEWEVADVRTIVHPREGYDLVIAYGLLHCMPDAAAIRSVVKRLQLVTRKGGYNIVCAFNNRMQDLRAHPNLRPTLLRHRDYIDLYRRWRLLHETDTDLHECHPTNNLPHTHSMTRLIAKSLRSAGSGSAA